MQLGKTSASDPKEYPPGSLMGKLRERKIIATFAAFVGSGVVIIEVAHHILVNHYHLPHQIVDICIVSLAGALIGMMVWRWFRGAEKRQGNVKVEVLIVPLVALLTLVIDLKFIFVMAGVSVNMLMVGIIAFCLGIAWVVFKSLQWAVSAPEAEKKATISPPIKQKPITFPEWKKSIVVLPFENISPEEGQDYFCDGMTEEIITDLSGIHDLCVLSRSSAMTFKGTKKTAPEIAKQLNVQYVLEGSVRKAGNNLRITAQLIDAANDTHLWAEKYMGTLDDIFDIQEKVSRSIVNSLRIKLSPKESKQIAERPIENIKAYECHLKARREILRTTEDGLERALQDIKMGLEIVGDNDLLYMDMALVYLWYVEYGIKADEETLLKAEEFSRKVAHMSPDSWNSHYLKGMITRFRVNALAALDHYKKALSINPDIPEVLLALSGGYCYLTGKLNSARPLINRLLEIDPLTPMNYFMSGMFYWMDGNFDESITAIEKMMKLEPESALPYVWRLYPMIWKNEYDKVFKSIDHFINKSDIGPSNKIVVEWCLFLKYALKGDKEKALNSVSKETNDIAWNDPELPWFWAGLFALINESEKALEWLERAVDRGLINYPLLAEKDPFLENIRGEKRFKRLMERVKHEWENFEV